MRLTNVLNFCLKNKFEFITDIFWMIFVNAGHSDVVLAA